MKRPLFSFLTLCPLLFLSASCSQGQGLQVDEIAGEKVPELLGKAAITYEQRDFTGEENYMAGLFGEIIDATVCVLFVPYYTVNWEKEEAYPNFYFKNIPLKAPRLLTDDEYHIRIFSAVVGNTEPIDELVGLFLKHNSVRQTGRSSLNPRILIGALIIKHILNLDDRETAAQITENMYLRYFLATVRIPKRLLLWVSESG